MIVGVAKCHNSVHTQIMLLFKVLQEKQMRYRIEKVGEEEKGKRRGDKRKKDGGK